MELGIWDLFNVTDFLYVYLIRKNKQTNQPPPTKNLLRLISSPLLIEIFQNHFYPYTLISILTCGSMCFKHWAVVKKYARKKKVIFFHPKYTCVSALYTFAVLTDFSGNRIELDLFWCLAVFTVYLTLSFKDLKTITIKTCNNDFKNIKKRIPSFSWGTKKRKIFFSPKFAEV